MHILPWFMTQGTVHMHFKYDWPDQNVSRETLVKYYTTQVPENQGISRVRAAILLALLAALPLTIPWLESALL